MAGIKNIVDSEIQSLENFIGRSFEQVLSETRAILTPRDASKNGTRSTADNDYYTTMANNGTNIQSKKTAINAIQANANKDLQTLQKNYEAGKIDQATFNQEKARVDQMLQSNLAAVNKLVESEQGAASTRQQAVKQTEDYLKTAISNYSNDLKGKQATLATAKKAQASQDKALVSAYNSMGREVAKVHNQQAKGFANAVKKSGGDPVSKSIQNFNKTVTQSFKKPPKQTQSTPRKADVLWADGTVDTPATPPVSKSIKVGAAKVARNTSYQNLYSNKRIVENMNNMGRGVDVSPLMGKTVSQHQQAAIEAFAKQGVKTSFKGDSMTMQYGNGAPITIKMAELAPGNTITTGGQKYHNRSMAATEYDENGRGKNVMTDAYGMQYAKIANLATRYIRDEEGNITGTEDGALTQAIKGGNAGSAQAIMSKVINEAIGKVGANVSQSVAKEVNADYETNKTNEQAYVQKGTYTMNPKWEEAIRNKNNVGMFQDILKQGGNSKTDLSNYYHEIPSQFMEAFNTIYDLKSRGDKLASEEISKMGDDNLAKQIYNGRMQDGKYLVTTKDAKGNVTGEYATNLHYALNAMDDYIAAGIIPRMDSIKEEAVGVGNRTLASANDLNPFGAWNDSASRASHQTNNYLQRANAPTMGTQGIWGSRAARMNGIDENSAERTQYTGTMMNDAEINDLIQKVNAKTPGLISEQLAQIMSTEEGGMITSESMAKELAAYLPQKKGAVDEDINLDFLKNLGLSMDQLSKLQKGEKINVDKLMTENGQFAKGVNVKAGDRLQAVEKTENGLRLHYNELTEARTGSKALVGYSGGRQSMRVVPDNVMAALNEAKFGAGNKGAQFITEHTHDSAKKGQFDIAGRMNEIVANAKEQGLNNQQILDAFKGTQYEKAMYMNEKGQIESSLHFDEANQKFRYTDAQGITKDFIDYDKNGVGNEAQIAKATIENVSKLAGQIEGITSESLSDFQILENNLAQIASENGIKDYQKSNPELFKDYVNQAKQYDYSEAVGSGNAKTIEAEGRVTYAEKERVANRTAIANAQLKHKGDEKSLQALQALYEAEEKATNKIGADREKAMSDQKKVQNALEASFTRDDYGNFGDQAKFSYSGPKNGDLGVADKGHTLEIGVDDKGRITFNGEVQSGISTKLDFDEEGNTGYTSEEYNKSLIAQAKKFMGANGLSQMVLRNGDQAMIMPTIDDTTLQSGNKMLSRTSGALHGMFKQSEDGTFEMTNDFSQVKNNLEKYAYGKDSKLVQRVDKANIANSAWGELVGANTGNKQQITENANDVYITSEKLKQMMTASETASKAEVLRNAQQLTMNKYAQSGTYEQTKDAVAGEMDKLAKMSVQELRQIESQLVNEIVGKVKSGEMEMTGQFHRYPSTSGNDMRYTNLKINDEIGNESGIMINRGLAKTVNGDFDGDHVPIRAMGLDYSDNYEKYFQATQGAKLVRDMHTEVARGMEAAEEGEGYGGHDVDKQKAMVSDYANRKNNQVAGLMSKYNKKYVGRFSNQSTAARGFARAFDLDEIGAARGNDLSDKQVAMTGIMRSFLESFEQDAISAKKVTQRMQKGSKVAIDELDPVYQYLRNGDFENAINEGIKVGILGTDKETGDIQIGRQWRFNKETAKAAGIDFDKEFAGMSNKQILTEAMNYFANVSEQVGLEPKKVVSHGSRHKVAGVGQMWKDSKARAKATEESNLKQKEMQSQPKGALTGTNAGAVAKQAEQAVASANEAKAEAEQAKQEADSIYKAYQAENAADYEYSHKRTLKEYGTGEVKGGTGGGVGATASQIDSIGHYQQQQMYGNKNKPIPQAVNVSSAKGTYGHKLAELMNATGTSSVNKMLDQINDQQRAELEFAKNAINQASFGTTKEKEYLEIQEQAEQLVAAGKLAAPELYGENALREHAMGGSFGKNSITGTEMTFSGEADIMAMKDDGSGYTAGDYKFSKDGSADTIAKRIMQQSIYLAQREQELAAQLEAINKGDMKGDAAKVEKELNALRQGNKTGNNTVNILRTLENGATEVVQARALDIEQVLKYMKASTEYVTLQNSIDKLVSKYGSLENLKNRGSNKELEKLTQMQNRQRELNASGLIQNTTDILAKAGLTATADGQLVYTANGRSAAVTLSGFNSQNGQFEEQMAGQAPSGKPKLHNREVSRHLQYARRASQLEQDIAKRQILVDQSSGSEKRQNQDVLRSAQQQLAVMQSKMALYNREERTLNGIKLSEKDIERLESQTMLIQQKKEMALAKIGANMKMEQGLLDKMLNGFKQQFSNFLGMNLTYQLVGKIRQMFSEIVQLTQQLDANMGATCC